MREARGFTYGLAIGAGLMFLLDPRQGGARRAYVRDKSTSALSDVNEAVAVGRRDLSNRVEGVIASLFSMRHHERVLDDVLVQRVRARLGHVCSHARTIAVVAKGDGCIELKGPVLADEHRRIVRAVAHVPGVREIDDDLDVHQTAGDIASLQGEHTRLHPLVRAWTPATRLVLGTTTMGLAIAALLRGHPLAFLLGGAGALAIARSIARHGETGPHPKEIAAKARTRVEEVAGAGLGAQEERETSPGLA
jgi:hypothetical protein